MGGGRDPRKCTGVYEQTVKHRAELERQRVQVESKLKTLLELRMDGEISAEEYAAKRTKLHDRQAGLRLQIESCERDDRDIADLAIKVLELAQSLKTRWKTASFAAKREILALVCENAESNQQNLRISPRKPFDLLSNGSLVSSSGAEETRTLNP